MFWKDKTKITETILREEDISFEGAQSRGSTLFLGRYVLQEVVQVLKKRNFIKEARKRDLWPLVFQVDSSSYPTQHFQIFHETKDPEKLVVDLKIKEGYFSFSPPLDFKFSKTRWRFLFLEWLTLQNPKLKFSPEDLPLPGQKHPGLKLSRKIMDLFIYVARLIKADGLVAFPAYFHNAVLFSRYFNFINPLKEAEVRKIRKTALSVSIKQLAWIVYWGCLHSHDGKVYEWTAEEQVYPLNHELKSYFKSSEYKNKVKQAEDNFSFTIDWECFKSKMKQNQWSQP